MNSGEPFYFTLFIEEYRIYKNYNSVGISKITAMVSTSELDMCLDITYRYFA
jgi:hypothetical protein